MFDFFKNIFGIRTKTVIYDDKNIPISTEDLFDNFSINKNKISANTLKMLVDNIINKSFSNRKEQYDFMQSIKEHYLIELVLDNLIDDAISSSDFQNGIECNYIGLNDNILINNIIQSFLKELNLFEILYHNVSEDLLLNGELFLRVVGNANEGVKELIDDVITYNNIAIYKNDKLLFYLKRDNNNIELVNKDKYVHFVLQQRKIKIELETGSKYIPTTIRIGQSFFDDIVKHLRQLELLEKKNIAIDIDNIIQPFIVKVNIPEDTPTADVNRILQKYDDYLNRIFDNDIEINNVSDILDASNKIKPIPDFSDSKGNLEQIQLKSEKQSDRQKEIDLKNSIANILGVPPSLFSNDSQSGGRLETIKSNPRYARKILMFRNSLIKPSKQLILLHLKLLGFPNVREEDLLINFKNAIDVASLQNLEYYTALLDSLRNTVLGISDLQENIKVKFDKNKILDFAVKQLPNVPDLKLVFEKYENVKDDVEGENSNPELNMIEPTENIEGENVNTEEEEVEQEIDNIEEPNEQENEITQEEPTENIEGENINTEEEEEVEQEIDNIEEPNEQENEITQEEPKLEESYEDFEKKLWKKFKI